MDATMRATCPGCQGSLKIPAAYAGQPVKCKKCGAVVRTKGPAPAGNGDGPDPAAFDFNADNGQPDDGLPFVNAPEPMPLPEPGPGENGFDGLSRLPTAPRFNPFDGPEAAPAPQPPVMYDPMTGQPLPPRLDERTNDIAV